MGMMALFSVLLLSFSVLPAFAQSSTATSFSPTGENPSYSGGSCTGSSPACADALSSGYNYLIATSSSVTNAEEATAYENENAAQTSVGSSPSISETSSGQTITFNTVEQFQGSYNDGGSGGFSYYQFNTDGYDSSGYLGSCTSSWTSNPSGSVKLDCNFNNSIGTDTFYMGVSDVVVAQSPGSTTATTDFWNTPNYAEVDSETICDDGTC